MVHNPSEAKNHLATLALLVSEEMLAQTFFLKPCQIFCQSIISKEKVMLRYLLYILRWVVLAIPGALLFNKVKQIFGIEDVYVAMMMSQAMMGAMVYFIDTLIFASGRVPIPFEVRR
jgi:hypothetical protein